MSIHLKGHDLNQRQLDAILPVMNDLMQGKVSQKQFEGACEKAMEAAGCPLGYDTTMPGAEKSIAERAAKWLLDGQVGLSSRAIYCQMTGNACERWSYPSDPDDLNRCLLLLDLIPEWKGRMGEMATRGTAWSGLAARWEELTATFLDEVGLDWSKAKSAPKTFALMKQLIGTDPNTVRFGGATIHF